MRYAWIAYLIPFIFVFRTDFLIGQADQTWLGTLEVIGATLLLVLSANVALTGVMRKLVGLWIRILTLLIAALLFLTLITNPAFSLEIYMASLASLALLYWRYGS